MTHWALGSRKLVSESRTDYFVTGVTRLTSLHTCASQGLLRHLSGAIPTNSAADKSKNSSRSRIAFILVHPQQLQAIFYSFSPSAPTQPRWRIHAQSWSTERPLRHHVPDAFFHTQRKVRQNILGQGCGGARCDQCAHTPIRT